MRRKHCKNHTRKHILQILQKQKTEPNWEFYDLVNDPGENFNSIDNPDYKKIIDKLHKQLIIEKNKTKDFELEIPQIS